jgi:thioredoxin 1
MAAEFTTDAFDTDVLGAKTPVLVDFWATWCGPCRQIAPVIDELAVKYEGRVSIGKVNVEEQPELAQRYGINAIPTLLLFKDGEIVERFQGVPPRSKLESVLDNA